MVALALQRKVFVLSLIKRGQNFAKVHILMVIIDICSLTQKICKFKPSSKNVNVPSQFCRGSISEKFDKNEFTEVSFKGNVYDFSVDYGAISVVEFVTLLMVHMLEYVFQVKQEIWM